MCELDSDRIPASPKQRPGIPDAEGDKRFSVLPCPGAQDGVHGTEHGNIVAFAHMIERDRTVLQMNKAAGQLKPLGICPAGFPQQREWSITMRITPFGIMNPEIWPPQEFRRRFHKIDHKLGRDRQRCGRFTKRGIDLTKIQSAVVHADMVQIGKELPRACCFSNQFHLILPIFLTSEWTTLARFVNSAAATADKV